MNDREKIKKEYSDWVDQVSEESFSKVSNMFWQENNDVLYFKFIYLVKIYVFSDKLPTSSDK
jgi:hypothetical protein